MTVEPLPPIDEPTSSSYPHPKGRPAPAKNIYLSFQGTGFSSGVNRSFEVVCGKNPPTITGGYAKWQVIGRPLDRGITTLQGYDPMQMTVDGIFGEFGDGWNKSDAAGQRVEADIQKLEWMCGSNFETGPSPAIYVRSYSSEGGQSNLIPPQVRGMPWIIQADGIEWGTAYRNKQGYRIWQEFTVKLQNYLNLHKAPQPDDTTSGGYFVSRAGRDTALRIAGSPAANNPSVDHNELARRICNSDRNNPIKGTSIRLRGKSMRSFRIKHGAHVWVPGHQIN